MDSLKLDDHCTFTFYDNIKKELICCETKLENYHGYCDIHKNEISLKTNHLSTEKNFELEKRYFTMTAKKLFQSLEKLNNKQDRIKIANKIFKLCNKHKYIVFIDKKLCETILSKLLEFKETEKFFNADKYLKMLFPNLFDDENFREEKEIKKDSHSFSIYI